LKYKIFSVYDHKGLVYGVPFFKNTNLAAIRDFGDAVQDQQTTLNRHPEDYQLFEIGEYDDNTAEIINQIPPKLMASASEFKKNNIKEITPLIQIPTNNNSEKVEVK
jgi:hypothetical protein